MQSIIVYRNPMEAAFWEMMSNGQMIPIFVAIIVFFAVLLTIQTQVINRFVILRHPERASYAAMIVSAMVAVFVAYKMWV